ncbi:MAG: hypothetical protein AAB558_04770, partial [Patescibacteria group bacterium]
MLASFMVALYALVSAAWADCNVTVQVTCSDCVVGQKWQAELYVFAADDSGVRAQVANVMEMESGGIISSGKLPQVRRFLDINGSEVHVITCMGNDVRKEVTISRDMLGVHALESIFEPLRAMTAEPPRAEQSVAEGAVEPS